ncbi:MAG: DUF6883 domain-containing protein [Planctomycetota bacterium]
MKLPGAERAVIEPAKIRDYLLSPRHPVGRFKAAFFVGLGYSGDDWQRLEADIREIARVQDAVHVESSEYGRKYETRCRLTGPSGRQADVVAVWIILAGEDAPRLVTAIPGTKA